MERRTLAVVREALRAAGEAQRAAIAMLDEIGAVAAESTTTAVYYDDDENPVATAERKSRWRAWLKRRGVAVFKVGQRTLALRADVDREIQARPLRAAKEGAASEVDMDAMLAAMLPGRRQTTPGGRP